MSNSTYTNLTYDANTGWWGTTVAGRLGTTDHTSIAGSHDQVTGRKALAVRPEPTNKDVALVFTAPHSGKINVSMANGGVFAPHQSVDEISFTFKHNDTVVKSVSDLDSSYNADGGRFFADTVELTVASGDKLYFVVHRNKQVANPQTYFTM